MSQNAASRRTIWYRAALIVFVVGFSTLTSYGVTRAWRGNSGRDLQLSATAGVGADTSHRTPFRSGRYLVAFVLLSSECGFSTEKETKKAIPALRASLHASQGKAFAKVSVVGIAIDDDLDVGMRYLQSLGRSVFDELSVGGSWLNELVTALVWRNGVATPETPQVVLVERRVDASEYPRNIDVQRDSVLLKVTGRDDLIAWVNHGTPLDFPRSPEVSSLP